MNEEHERDPDLSLPQILELFLEERPPDVQAFLLRFPEHAEALRELLPAVGALDAEARRLVADEHEGSSTSSHAPTTSVRQPHPQDPGNFVATTLARIRSHGYRQGRFEIEEELSRGGQGVVLAAWDETLQRPLAMKVALSAPPGTSRSPATSAVSLGRFLEEAQVTAQLDHPGVVPVHDLGLDDDGRVYFTMKRVRGRDLRGIYELVRSDSEGWNRTRALGVLLRVCEAMLYAHSKGVIHRDLKPSNVMVGEFGEVYVMDWGLARVLAREDRRDLRIRPEASATVRSLRREPENGGDSPLVTMDGDVVGTPAFMSPEQARGEFEAMGPHSDVYAVGAMLYQLLTGRMPYAPSGSPPAARAIWARVKQGPPEPVHALAPDGPPELEAICEKAMAREIPQRYSDMRALAEDLRAYLENRVVRAHRTGPVVELRKWVQRNRALAAALASVVLAITVGLGVSLRLERSARAHAQQAAREREGVLQLAAFQRLEDLRREADRLWPIRPEDVPRYERWLARAREVVAGLEPRSGEIGYRAQLAAVRSRAVALGAAELEAARREHPRFAELERLREKLAALQRAQAVRSGAAQPPSFELEGRAPPEDAGELCAAAWPLVDPFRSGFGREPEGLALAQLALERVQDDAQAARAGLTLAWALFACGLDEPALIEGDAALIAAPPSLRPELEANLAYLKSRIAATATIELENTARELATVEAEVERVPSFRFTSDEDAWWYAQLEKLVAAIEAFADPERGLMAGVSRAHGWGILRRKTFAETLLERSVLGAEAAQRWKEAIASIRDRDECPFYDGLVVTPQPGLLPIGRDSASGLWEFAHLLSGEPARRGEDRQLVRTPEMGIVLVLIPGGTFWMGAQSSDPADRNHDPETIAGEEAPVHEVRLSPFFLSKFELTQGQWQAFTGHNPSHCSPERYVPRWNARGKAWSALLPVEQVSWYACQEPLARMELELPSEAQWEYAARAGTQTPWWCGATPESLSGAANLMDTFSYRSSQNREVVLEWESSLNDGHSYSSEVGTFLANPFGLHDVIGNVTEWCADGFDARFYERGSWLDPVAPATSAGTRVVRGGGFQHGALWARSACRENTWPDDVGHMRGLRPARRLTP